MCSLATKVCASLALSLLPLEARRVMEKWGWLLVQGKAESIR